MLTQAPLRSSTRSRRSHYIVATTFVAVVGLILALSACGSGTTESTVIGESPTASAIGQPGPGIVPYSGAPYMISVSNNELNTTSLEVTAGQGVLFVNAEDDSDVQHEFVAEDGSFDTNILDPGGQYYVAFSGEGTIAFYDALNPDITGQVVVTAGETAYEQGLPTPGAWVAVGPNGLSSATTRIKVGDTVHFYNSEDDNPVDHQVVADDDSFDTGVLSPNDSYAVTFDSKGTFPFHDDLNSSIEGTIIVE